MDEDSRDSARAIERAESPTEISERGWRRALLSSFRGLMAQETSLAAAAIAFYIVWTLLPALAFAIVVLTRLVGKARVLTLLAWLRLDLPESFNAIVVAQFDAIARNSGFVSAATLFAAGALALWGGMRGAGAVMTALNLVYQERETRSRWQRATVAFALSLVGGVFVVAALGTIISGALTSVPSNAAIAVLISPSRWPLLIAGMLLVLAIAYRYGPSRQPAKWRWVTWGASAAATLWVCGSFAFALIAAKFVHASPLLGSLGSVVLFLFWTYLTVLAILLGAHINAKLELQTASDTRSKAP